MPNTTGLIANALGAIVAGGTAISQNKAANNVYVPDVHRTTSPYAMKILEEANRLKNSQMPGSAEAGREIYQNESNAIGGIERNASSGSQALALVAAAHGQTNQAFNQKQKVENDYHLQTLNNWNNANVNLITEDERNYQDEVRRQLLAMNEKNGLRNSAAQNGGNAMNTLLNAFQMYGTNLFSGSGNGGSMMEHGNGAGGYGNAPSHAENTGLEMGHG